MPFLLCYTATVTSIKIKYCSKGKLKKENVKKFYERKRVKGEITNDKWNGKITEMQPRFRKINIKYSDSTKEFKFYSVQLHPDVPVHDY
jgi:hypothetical protein